jgi:hypothetical protein
MVGYNRGMDPEAMRAGVRAGTIENVMFPKDPLKNLPKIIETLESYYPFSKDQFIFGPFCQITWCVPTLIKLNIGLLIELPDPVRIAIIGTLHAKLPKEDAAIISLNAAFLGLIDFNAKMLSFDASIYDSYLGYGKLKFSIEGDIIFRLSWGKRKAFVYSMGGFHPAYKVPTDLAIPSKIKRMTITIWKDNPKLVLTHYFAITSNTVQFGGALDFLYKKWGFSVEGGLWLDTLFQFSPFMFIVDIGAKLAVKRGSTNICSVGLGMTLSGPNPWHAKGYAKFSIWIVSFKVTFDKTFGDKHEIPLEESTVLPQFFDALEDRANWKGTSLEKSTGGILISIYSSDAEIPVVDSCGYVEVNQEVIPLDYDINRFGTTIPRDVQKVRVTDVWIGKTVASPTLVSESFDDSMTYVMTDFAKSQFTAMAEDEKLTAPSYEPFKSGVKIRDNDQRDEYRGVETSYTLNYEQIICDDPDVSGTAEGRGLRQFSQNLSKLTAAGSVSRSSASLKRKKLRTTKATSRSSMLPGTEKRVSWEKNMMEAVARGVK